MSSIKNSKAHQTILRPLQFNKNCINFVSLVFSPAKHCVYWAVSGLCIVMALLFVQKSSLIIIIRAPQSSVTCYTDSASSQRTNITAWWGHCTRGTWHNHTSLQSHFCFLNPVDIHGAYENSPVSSLGLYLDAFAFAWICQLFKTL